jgi:hypothetical protein
LQYQVEAVTLLLNQQLAKRSDQNLSNIQADKEEEAGARLADFDEVEAPEAVSSTSSSSKVSTTNPHADWDSSDDESGGKSQIPGRVSTPSEAGTAQITVQQKELKQRIDALTAVQAESKRKLIECAADISNTTAAPGKNKSGSEFLENLKSIKISPDASNAENAKSIKDLLVAWLGCNLQDCWALTPWFCRIRNSGIDGYLPCIRASVNKIQPAAESDPAHADRAAQVAKAEADMAIEEAEVKLQERRQALNARKAQLAAGPDDQVFPWAGAGGCADWSKIKIYDLVLLGII